ncbi:helix-turn-helix domain-containing protein [Novosphingopyxis sp. YJ-S2-01]|uniref:helix-turn-helix domain-containing protein n=1 Tax=Novosphingopyxis sp. YJ-S2-01 TaxID=2794021 RepID=UPI0018DD1CB7|nr:hypothetical protein [Novosphingopyxis sp. YJ-S2-01]MBH9536907.1 hypothetical protein [Novosphingopyxis sp. YJ-S2-01]
MMSTLEAQTPEWTALPDAVDPVTATMSPGTYLRKRREASGLSMQDVAQALRPKWKIAAINMMVSHLAELENDEGHVLGVVVRNIAAAFPMDANVYNALVELR